ncbi:MAG: Flp pilus assembly protein CpaB [Pseudomonadota bacterium]
MRLGFILILIAGVGLAGFAGYLVTQQTSQLEKQLAAAKAQAAKVVPTVEVYIAKEDLPYGTQLTPKMVKKFKWPKSLLPEGHFEAAEDLFGENQDEERRLVIRAMDKNDLIVATKITAKGEDAGLVSRLGQGRRAFSLKVNATSGAFLRPGDLVDVYWTGRDRGEMTTRLLLDAVQLIAINRDLDSSTARNQNQVARTVTVAVDPTTVARLVQAQNTGSLLISLRGLGDTEEVGDLSFTQSDFFGIEEAEEVVEDQKCFTNVRKGTQVVRTEIPCSN